jgi:plasmid stability protein
MAKMIQVRNVPDELHRKLKARAATSGLSLSDYLLDEIRKTAERPTVEELMEHIKRRGAPRLTESAAEAVRAERDRR